MLSVINLAIENNHIKEVKGSTEESKKQRTISYYRITADGIKYLYETANSPYARKDKSETPWIKYICLPEGKRIQAFTDVPDDRSRLYLIAVPAVAKVMDYNKFKYEKQKKLKEAQKKQRETSKEIKEYRLSVTIDVGDFETRRRNAESYLKKGHKIKAFIRFKGRQIAHPELGSDVLLRFADALSDVADIETKPQIEGRQIYMMLAPKK